MFDAVTYAAAVAAAKQSGGGGAEYFSFDSTFKEVSLASNGGKRVVFGGEVSVVTPLAPAGYVNLYVEIDGANYIDFTPMGGGEEIFFHTIYDASGNPLLGKLISITVTCADNDVWHSQVTFINPAT